MAADISVEILSENPALRIYDMVWTGTNYIAVGGTSGAEVWTSTDGISWTSRTVPTSSYSLLRVAYGNGIAAALSDDMLIYSTDRGTTWTKQTSYVSPYVMSPSIAFWSKTNTFYILVFGTLYKTTDFSSLTACLNTSKGYPDTIITSDSALWALADSYNYPSIYTSSDGINFSNLGMFAYSIDVWKGICIDESYLCFSAPTRTNTVFVYNLTTHTSSIAGAFRKSWAIAYDGFQPVIVGVYYSAAESGIYDWNTSAGTFDVIENSAGKTYYTILYREDLDIFIAAGDSVVAKFTRRYFCDCPTDEYNEGDHIASAPGDITGTAIWKDASSAVTPITDIHSPGCGYWYKVTDPIFGGANSADNSAFHKSLWIDLYKDQYPWKCLE
jgi:hypothetical protein